MKNFTLGLVGAPFGLKGFVKIRSFSGETGHFLHLKQVTLKKDGMDEVREVAEVELKGSNLLIRFAGIESPEAAAVLSGSEIIADRKYAAPLNKGEYYVEDLKGMEVINLDGEKLGIINNIIEGGGGDLVEVELPSGQMRFAPFRKEFFGAPDFDKAAIVLLETWILMDVES